MAGILEKIHLEVLEYEREHTEPVTHLLVTEEFLLRLLTDYANEFDHEFPSKRLLEQIMDIKIVIVNEVKENKGYILLRAVKKGN